MRLTARLALALSVLSACPAAAFPLSSSGSHLPLPFPNIGDSTRAAPGTLFPAINQTSPNTFTGTWSAPAQPAWVGTWSATGPRTNNQNAGNTVFDFSALPTGALPTGTFVRFGDVDLGAANSETYRLRAFSDTAGNVPLTLWLEEPVGTRAAGGTGPGGTPFVNEMPGWSYNPANGEYFIDGNTVAGNPNIAFVLQTNQPVVRLEVDKTAITHQLDLLAPPIPEPASGIGTAAALLLTLTRSPRQEAPA